MLPKRNKILKALTAKNQPQRLQNFDFFGSVSYDV